MTKIPLPPHLSKHAAQQPTDPVEPKDAATIVVVRDGEHGIEAFLMRRQTSMAFAAGFYVFPGGGVHASDWPGRSEVPWIGPGDDVWAERWRTDTDTAHALVVCAVRETFEETGILLAGPSDTEVVPDTSDLEPARRALEDHTLDFGEFLREHGCYLRADLLGAWAHWITPSFEPRRYDTRFFVAALPTGQSVGAMSREADRVAWSPLADILGAVDRGDAAMMPPTVETCREVAQYRATDLVTVAGRREFRTIEPTLIESDGELFLTTDRTESEEGGKR